MDNSQLTEIYRFLTDLSSEQNVIADRLREQHRHLLPHWGIVDVDRTAPVLHLIEAILQAQKPQSPLVAIRANGKNQPEDGLLNYESTCPPLIPYLENKIGKGLESLPLDWGELNSNELATKPATFDFIYADLPLNHRNFLEFQVAKDLGCMLAPRGLLCFIHTANFSGKGKETFKDLLKVNDLGIKAVLDLGPVHPATKINVSLIIVGRKWSEESFVANARDTDQHELIAMEVSTTKSLSKPALGQYVQIKDFQSYAITRLKDEIRSLMSLWPDAEVKSISDVSENILTPKASGDHKFEPHPNAVYFPISGASIVKEASESYVNKKNLIQIILKESVSPEFFICFFKTKIGAKIRRLMEGVGTVPSVSNKSLSEAKIIVPPKKQQIQVVEASSKLHQLRIDLDQLQDELATNPFGNDQLIVDLAEFSNTISVSTKTDQMRALVGADESKTLEFKETYRLCTKKQEVRKDLEDTVMKTIAGFLNSDGGTLLVGVRDNKEITGINVEIDKLHKGSVDKFLLQFSNTLKKRIGEQFYPYIEYNLMEIGPSVQIFAVECKPSEFECWLDGDDFYVRTNPATQLLKGPKITQYVKTRFSK